VAPKQVAQLPAPAIAPIPAVVIPPAENTISVAQPPAAAAPVATPAPAVTAPVAAPPAPATPRLITSGVEYLQSPAPVYPAMSKRMGEQGKVVLRVLVNDKGLPEQVQVHASSGFARLDEAARQAVLRALFKPHVEEGRAVPVYVLVPLNFKLA
jgi:protein TonB